MKPEISIVMPAIRPNNWKRIYDSIRLSTKRPFELIIVGPFGLPEELQLVANIKYVRDFGSPVRATNIGILLCEGKYIFSNHADDAYFIEGALDKNLDELILMGDNIKNVIICKYSESENLSNVDRYQNDDYYKITNAYQLDKTLFSSDWWIFNVVIWHREYFEQFGGFDPQFEVCPMAHGDLALRAQQDGAIVKMTNFPLLHCSHMPGTSGDHAPVHYAQGLHDDPIFRNKYKNGMVGIDIKLNPMGWKSSPAVWDKRFQVS